MRYPVVNVQALGRATLFPQASLMGQQAPAAQPRVLGQAEQASLAAARQALDDAHGVFQRVQITYPQLVATIGDDDARKAFEQAQDALKSAQDAYEEALAYSQGTSR